MENVQKPDSKAKKMGAIIVTLLVLLIPIAYMYGIINDREDYKREARQAVAKSWANEQRIYSPTMKFSTIEDKKVKENELELNNYDVNVNIQTEVRKKGIFKIPLYTADVKINGDFINHYGNLAGKEITLKYNVSDSKGFATDPIVKLLNEPEKVIADSQYTTKLNTKEENIPFEISYKLRGVDTLSVYVVGKNNNLEIAGNWKDPSFEGDFLPVNREINNEEFNAQWHIPGIAASDQKSAAVSLLVPVDNYRMAERTLKYAFLFLSLTFLSYFVFEITSKEKNKIHPVQYCLLGGSLLIFYLLLVSLSEFMPFVLSYIISALMIISLITSYTYFVITKRQNRGFSMFIMVMMILLYSFLYTLLSLQDFALLIGSLGLFVIIAVTMYITRNVEWYN